jgi:hypothetical protein
MSTLRSTARSRTRFVTPAEEVVLAVVAAAWGWRAAERRRHTWFLPAEPARGDSPPTSPTNPSQ